MNELIVALRKMDIEKAKQLIGNRNGIRVKQGEWTPLHEAAARNLPELYQLLVENGADENAMFTR